MSLQGSGGSFAGPGGAGPSRWLVLWSDWTGAELGSRDSSRELTWQAHRRGDDERADGLWVRRVSDGMDAETVGARAVLYDMPVVGD
jgi:hypothetical protein